MSTKPEKLYSLNSPVITAALQHSVPSSTRRAWRAAGFRRPDGTVVKLSATKLGAHRMTSPERVTAFLKACNAN